MSATRVRFSCAAMIMGENPLQAERLWPMMFRGYFYPAGREKVGAVGGADLGLWDIKGKAPGVPAYGEGEARLAASPWALPLSPGQALANPPTGFGREARSQAAPLVADITDRRRRAPIFERPDGLVTNW